VAVDLRRHELAVNSSTAVSRWLRAMRRDAPSNAANFPAWQRSNPCWSPPGSSVSGNYPPDHNSWLRRRHL